MEPSVIVTALFSGTVAAAVVTAISAHWNELSRAREERRQARLTETYVAVIELTITACDSVERTHPLMPVAGEPGPPKIPTDEEQRRLRARLSAYGSPAMRRAFQVHATACNAFFAAARDFDSAAELAKASPNRAGLDAREKEARKAMDEIREKQVYPLGDALLDLANAELAERRSGRWARLRARVARAGLQPFGWARAQISRLFHRDHAGQSEG